LLEGREHGRTIPFSDISEAMQRRCGYTNGSSWRPFVPLSATGRACILLKAQSLSKGCPLTGVVPANSYRVLLEANGEIIWETVRDGEEDALPGRTRDRLPPALRRRLVEAPADRLATPTV